MLLLEAPISFSCATSSWFRSFHVRWSVEKTAGLYVRRVAGALRLDVDAEVALDGGRAFAGQIV